MWDIKYWVLVLGAVLFLPLVSSQCAAVRFVGALVYWGINIGCHSSIGVLLQGRSLWWRRGVDRVFRDD